jgi:hypothetical protein
MLTLGRFVPAHGHELHDCRPPSHRFRDTLHELRLLRAREEPAAFLAHVGIDARAHVVEDLRHVLHLVEDHREAQPIKEAVRIVPEARERVGILEQQVLRMWEKVPQQVGSCPRAGGR